MASKRNHEELKDPGRDPPKNCLTDPRHKGDQLYWQATMGLDKIPCLKGNFINRNCIYTLCALTFAWNKTRSNETVAKSVCKLPDHPPLEAGTGVGSTAVLPEDSTLMEEGGLDLPNILETGAEKKVQNTQEPETEPEIREFTEVHTAIMTKNTGKKNTDVKKKIPNTSSINVLVQLLNGKTRNIIIEHTNTNIETLIMQISQETGIPIKDLRVLHQSKEISHLSRTRISDLNISNGSRLDIRLRIKGGMDGEEQKTDLEKAQIEKLKRLHDDLNNANIYITGNETKRFNIRDRFKDTDNDTIYRSLEYIFQKNEVDLIDPAQSSINNIFNDDDTVVQDAIQDLNTNILVFKKKIIKGNDEDVKRYQTPINKPIVYITATEYKDRNLNMYQNNNIPSISDYGNHWVCLIITPRNYQGLLKHRQGAPIPERVFLFDSLNSKRNIPKRFKEGLTSEWNKVCLQETEEAEIQYTSEYPPSLAEDAQFYNKTFLTQQNENSCGYWAMYNAVMLVLTGDESFYDEMHKTTANRNELNHLAEAHIREVFESYIPFLNNDAIDEKIRTQTDFYRSNNFRIPTELKLNRDGSLDMRTKAAKDYVNKLKEDGRCNEIQSLSKLNNRDEIARRNKQTADKPMNATPERRSRSIFRNDEKQNSTDLRERDHNPLEGKRAQDRDTSASPIGPSPIKRNKSELNGAKLMKQPNLLNYLNKHIHNKKETETTDENKLRTSIKKQKNNYNIEPQVNEDTEKDEIYYGGEKPSENNIEQNQSPSRDQEAGEEEEKMQEDKSNYNLNNQKDEGEVFKIELERRITHNQNKLFDHQSKTTYDFLTSNRKYIEGMNLLHQTYELVCSDTMIQLHDSANELKQNILTQQEENKSFMTATKNYTDVHLNCVDEKFNALYKEIEELKRQLKHNGNTKDQTTTEETDPNVGEMRKEITKSSNEEVKTDVEQLIKRQDGTINEITQYIKEMDRIIRQKVDQLEAINVQEKKARDIINEQIEKLTKDNTTTIASLKEQIALNNKNTDRIEQINILREVSDQRRMEERVAVEAELFKMQKMAINHFKVCKEGSDPSTTYNDIFQSINEEFNKLNTKNNNLIVQLEQQKKEMELREKQFLNMEEEFRQSMLLQLRKENELEYEHQKKQMEELLQENKGLKNKLAQREKDLIDTIREWNQKEGALKENINDQEVKTDERLRNMLEEIEKIKRSMDIETEGPVNKNVKQEQNTSSSGHQENIQNSNKHKHNEYNASRGKREESLRYNKKDPEKAPKPIRIAFRGRLMLTSFRNILKHKGDLEDIYNNNAEVIDFEHEGQKNWKLMFVWNQQVLRPTEEELKQAEGNMNTLAIMLNKEPNQEHTNNSFRKDYNAESSSNHEGKH